MPAEHLQGVWQGFVALGSCRPAGFNGAMPIPWTAAQHYAAVQGWHGPAAARFWALISGMDTVYLAHVNKPPDSKTKPKAR